MKQFAIDKNGSGYWTTTNVRDRARKGLGPLLDKNVDQKEPAMKTEKTSVRKIKLEALHVAMKDEQSKGSYSVAGTDATKLLICECTALVEYMFFVATKGPMGLSHRIGITDREAEIFLMGAGLLE